jgi:prophage antirepressor-like protein
MFNVQSTNEQLPAIQDSKGEWYFSAKETVLFAEVATANNASAWVKNNIPPKWYLEIKTPGKEGRPSLYLTKPGFYYAVCQGKSLKAMDFRDWVFETLLLKLEASGGYIMPNATSEQIEALQADLAEKKLIIDEKQKLIENMIQSSHPKRLKSPEFEHEGLAKWMKANFIVTNKVDDDWAKGQEVYDFFKRDCYVYRKDSPSTPCRTFTEFKKALAVSAHLFNWKPYITPGNYFHGMRFKNPDNRWG